MAHIQKRSNGRYRVRYRDPQKRERSKTFDRRADAERFRSEVDSRINHGSWIAPEKAQLPFRHFSRLWLSTIDVKPSTRANYESILERWLLPELADAPISSVHWSTLEAFKARLLGHGLSPKTVRNILNVATPILATAVRDGAIQTNPAREVTKPRSLTIHEADFATAEEVLQIASQMDAPDRLLVTFAAFSGLRAGECGGLQVRDIDFLGRKVNVRRSVTEPRGKVQFTTPKNGKTRTVPIPPFLVEQLSVHLATRGVNDDPTAQVFVSRTGDVYRHSNFYKRVFKPTVQAVGREGFRFHDLRHTYATLLISQGAHPRVVMDRLGHSSIQITMNTYGHLFPSEDEATINGLEAAFQEASAIVSRPDRGLSVIQHIA